MPTGVVTRETMSGPDSEPAGLGQIFLELGRISRGYRDTWNISKLLFQGGQSQAGCIQLRSRLAQCGPRFV